MNIIKLTREDLVRAAAKLPIESINNYDFKLSKMTMEQYDYADKVVFTDTDGKEKVLKDKYGDVG